MRNTHLRHLIFVSLAAVLGWSALAAVSNAQSSSDAQSEAEQQPAPDENEQSRDQQPQTVQGQLARLKREQTREKSSCERTPVRDDEHRISVRVRNYVELREQNIVMQRRDYSCGAATLATVARYYWGDNVTEDLFLEALDQILTAEEIDDRIENGLAMSDLRRAAVKLGYQAVVGKTTFQKLLDVKVPVIVGISPEGHDHFVVYRGTELDWVYVADPIRGNIRMPAREFRKQWQENAVLAIHKPGHKVKQSSPLSLHESDVRRGELNRHLIQTQQSRLPRIKQTLR